MSFIHAHTATLSGFVEKCCLSGSSSLGLDKKGVNHTCQSE
ncbi:hypothetical protein DsansV1_C16g0141011 [Dioscorea sansibarensis]